MKEMLDFAYRVKINYDHFLFDDGEEALEFAKQAFRHQVECKDEDYDVRIDLIPIKDAEDPEDNGEASAGAAMLRGE